MLAFLLPIVFAMEASLPLKELNGPMLQGRLEHRDPTARLIVLDFWASWCDPCRESLPAAERLQKKYASHGVRLIAVNLDETAETAKKFIQEIKFTLPTLWDRDRRLADLLGLTAIPATVGLDPSGKILFQETGYTDTKLKSLETKINQRVGK